MPGTDESIELSDRAIQAAGTSLREIPIATHSFRQRYLFAFATQAEVSHHIRTQALENEVQLEEIMRDWEALQSRVADLINREAGHAETIRITRIPDQYQTRTDAVAHEQLFQKILSQSCSKTMVLYLPAVMKCGTSARACQVDSDQRSQDY